MLIYPMFAMVLLVFVVGVFTFKARVRAVRSGKVKLKFFRTMTGDDELPEDVLQGTRQFINLFEVPVLFYVACLAAMIMRRDGDLMVGLAWAFVLMRCWQAYIHMTYNNVIHRMRVYFGGFLIMLCMWVLLAIP